MIPFEELSAALDQWRLRNGLPVGTTEVPFSGGPIVARAAAPAPGPAPAAWAPAPSAAPVAPRPVSTTARPATDSDVLSLEDGDVEDEYANEGDDFSMNFASQQQPESGNPVGSASGSIGGPDPAPLYDEEVGEEAYAEPPQEEPDAYAAAPSIPELADDPAFDPPPAAYEDEESEEDWSKLRAAASGDTIDSDVPDEATVVGDHAPKR